MSSIAYITDSKMIELHRLNNHKSMNFWRLSTNINFSNFSNGDLVFFLSKDKDHMNQKEKGIVGFGRLENIEIDTIKNIWDKYKKLNGYNSLEEFKDAIIKASKIKELPQEISSLYLENVTFFQPIYLSEVGFKISNNIESYIYLEDEYTNKLLNIAKSSVDIWTLSDDLDEKINYELSLRTIFKVHNEIGDVKYDENDLKKIEKKFKDLIKATSYRYMNNSKTELYKLDKDNVSIMMYHDKDADGKSLIGQARLYRYKYKDKKLSFEVTDHNTLIEFLMNN